MSNALQDKISLRNRARAIQHEHARETQHIPANVASETRKLHVASHNVIEDLLDQLETTEVSQPTRWMNDIMTGAAIASTLALVVIALKLLLK